jgi:hypothetical protein
MNSCHIARYKRDQIKAFYVHKSLFWGNYFFLFQPIWKTGFSAFDIEILLNPGKIALSYHQKIKDHKH